MQNLKCISMDDRQCPDNFDICCQFCIRNYSPCVGKCSGCWDQLADIGYMSEIDQALASEPVA